MSLETLLVDDYVCSFDGIFCKKMRVREWKLLPRPKP